MTHILCKQCGCSLISSGNVSVIEYNNDEPYCIHNCDVKHCSTCGFEILVTVSQVEKDSPNFLDKLAMVVSNHQYIEWKEK